MEKHTELVSDNGLVFKDMIKSDRLVLLTTSDSRLAIYSPNGKLVTLLSAAQLGGKTNPQSLTVSTDSQTLFFLDATKNLHALDLGQKDKGTPQLLYKELKTTELASVNNELYFVNGDKLVVLAKQGATYAESKKKLNFPPAWKPVSAETQLSVVGPSHLLVRDGADHFGVFDTQTGELIEHTDHVNPGKLPLFDKGHQASFKPALNSLFGVHRGAVVQFAYQVGAVITRFEPGEFGTIQTFGISGNKLYLMTEHHYMVFLIPAIDHKDRNPPLVTVIKLKFPANNPLSKVFHNGEDLLHLIFVAGTKVDTVRISPDWDKFEPVVLNTGGKPRGSQQHYDGHSQEEYVGQSDEEGYPGPAGQRATKPKRKKVVKKKKRSFDLGGMQHMKASEYNALKDEHLKSYFYCDRIRKHLQKQHLITRDGYIIENPEEYRKNQKLLKEHYRSQEPKKTAKKKVHGKAPKQADQGYDEEGYQSKTHTNRPGDAERVKKDDFREFLNDVEQVAGGQSKAGAKPHDSQKSGTELGSEKAIAEAKAKAEREASAKAHAEKDAAAKAQAEKDAAAKAQAEKDAAAKAQAEKDAAAKLKAEKDAAAKAQAEKDAAKAKEAANKDAAAKAQPQNQATPANPAKPAEQKEPTQPAAPKPPAGPQKPQNEDNEF